MPSQVILLPCPLSQACLLYELNNCFYAAKYCERTIKPAISCKKDGPSSAVVECTSVAAATLLCNVNSVYYEGILLQLEQNKSEPVLSDEVKRAPAPLTNLTDKSDKVKLFNLPDLFSEDSFQEHVKNILLREKLIPDNHNFKLIFLENDPHENSAVIQSVQTATKFCNIPEFKYKENEILRFQVDSYNAPNMTTCSETPSETDLTGQMTVSLNMDEDHMNNNHHTKSDLMSELETEGEILAFIKLLIKHRCDRPNAKWADIYHLVVGDLDLLFEITTNSLICEKRRNSLSDAYRKQKKKYGCKKIDYNLFCAIAKMRQEDDISCMTVGHTPNACPARRLNDEQLIRELVAKHRNNLGKYKTKGPRNLDETGYFSKGCFMNADATRALIYCVKNNEENFDGIVRNESVWAKVAQEMAESGFKYEQNVMKKTLTNLVSKYKDFKDVVNRTGQGNVQWEFYEDMLHLMSGNAAAEPMLTASVGSTCTMVSRAEMSTKSRRKPTENGDSSCKSIAQSMALLVQHIVKKK
ncbi:DNA-directed RNA polymerase subunit beta'' [Frankliniella fusca]|uniref:DNA-directed RNA polymerase subunit beta n=1 Tax=Frankliniella fusca TaxID=407009 RepID=A0AAE1LUF2_9NEOP|nr:DNA-directed RNA polymerase subunit beta'' [Frankliniella fusca]